MSENGCALDPVSVCGTATGFVESEEPIQRSSRSGGEGGEANPTCQEGAAKGVMLCSKVSLESRGMPLGRRYASTVNQAKEVWRGMREQTRQSNYTDVIEENQGCPRAQ